MRKGEAKDSDESDSDDDKLKKRPETMAEEEARLKKEFKKQVKKYDTDNKKKKHS